MNSLETQTSEQIIERILAQLQENGDKRKANAEMIENFLGQSMEYNNALELYEARKKELEVAKNKKMMQTEGFQLEAKRKEINEERSELRESLSAHLGALFAAGNQEVNVAGKQFKIKVVCKVETGQMRMF